MKSHKRIAPAEFEKLVQQCDLIVSHAGIGTILTAQRTRRPIVIVPRRFENGEHRNNHQVATARNLTRSDGLLIAMDKSELEDRIAEGLMASGHETQESRTVTQLHNAITSFIETGKL